jgi:methionyl-tRNA formyltransferase
MRIVFMGTAALACPLLCALAGSDRHETVCVITQPDRPKGRNLKVSPSPVKSVALAAGLHVETPELINTPEALELVRGFTPDIIVVVAYGQILKQALLDVPPKGCLNIHASLLPKYRGAAPVQWALANGESETGVTAMMMNARMDAGEIVGQRTEEIRPDDTAGSLHDRLAAHGAYLLLDVLDAVQRETAVGIPQVDSEATYAPKLTKGDGRIDWRQATDVICRRVRAFNPWPCCFCQAPRAAKRGANRMETLRVLVAEPEPGHGVPGTILDIGNNGLLVAAGEGAVRLREVQPPGKQPMSGHDYACGHPVHVGMQFSIEGGG